MNYKKTISVFFLILLIIFSIFFIFQYSNIFNFVENIFQLLLFQETSSFSKFIWLIIFLNFAYFLTPLPATPLILFNGFILGFFGFILSIFFISISSIIIFVFSNSFLKKNLSEVFFYKFLASNIKKDKVIKKTNFFSIFLSRFIIPHFSHNFFFGFYKLSVKKFYLSILAAEIPATYALNSIGMSFSNFILIKNYKANDLFLSYNFIIPLLFILFIVLFSGTIKKIIINKFN